MESMWEKMLQIGINLGPLGWGIKVKKDWVEYMAKQPSWARPR